MAATKFRNILFHCAAFLTVAVVSLSCSGHPPDTENGTASAQQSSAANNATDSPPTIQWFKGPSSDPVSGSVSLGAAVKWTTTGTMKVDFLVDGAVAGTSTNGGKLPGVALFDYYWTWNTASYADGPHTLAARVTDNSNRTADTPPLALSVLNHVTMAPRLKLSDGYAASGLPAAGVGTIAVDLATGKVSGYIALTDASVTAAHIHDGYAGMWGEQLIALIRDSSDANRWLIPADTTLTAEQLEQLRHGALYLDVESVAYPDGELRAQLK